MRAFYLAYTTEVAILPQAVAELGHENLPQAVAELGRENLPQAVAELEGENLPQAVAELEGENLPQAVAEIPWGHNVLLLEKLKDPQQRLWYARKTIENGWSRAMLAHQIESGLHRRQGKAISNFGRALPRPQSDLAQQLLKDPYHFGFLTLADDARELDLQRGLLNHIRDFLLELGVGFAFVASQHHLEVGGQDYYIDLLFYHLRLRCFVGIDLKTEEFKPEFVGKMNFYLSAVDEQLRQPSDRPSIGLILCKTKNKVVVEYALRDTTKPMGVASYEIKLMQALPKNLKGKLPTVEELEAELGR
jgi:predicted nuclease of restriction endonuclease-like (RecB) superfamily